MKTGRNLIIGTILALSGGAVAVVPAVAAAAPAAAVASGHVTPAPDTLYHT